ncbi:hypothetical protein AB0E74_19440, partial [Streptomyces sp. NPDC030392]|uniref:hypothetical protein n=1 Tax=Streptomyces sp. NPDC030392 TaxID=3155468 RepID=UPI0033F3AF63
PPARPAAPRRPSTRASPTILGLAHNDADLVEFLRRAGLDETGIDLDDPHLVEWRGGRAHQWEAA